LDLTKNAFSDGGFEAFAVQLQRSMGITHLDISKNRELNDEGSLISLFQSIAKNRNL
jgi:hypothetical protein